MSCTEVLNPTLRDLLDEFNDSPFKWSILFLSGMPKYEFHDFLNKYGKDINNSLNGLFVTLEELKNLSNCFFQMYEVIVLGSYDEKLLQRYAEEKDMYTNCDVVIQLIDCAFWEMYVKDFQFYKKIKCKFVETEILNIE